MSPVGLISLKSDIVILKHVFYYLFFMFEYSKRYPLYLTFHNSQIKQVVFFLLIQYQFPISQVGAKKQIYCLIQ